MSSVSLFLILPLTTAVTGPSRYLTESFPLAAITIFFAIQNVPQIKALRRDCRPDFLSVTAVEYRWYGIRFETSLSHIEEDTDNRPDHMIQKSVTTKCKHQIFPFLSTENIVKGTHFLTFNRRFCR